MSIRMSTQGLPIPPTPRASRPRKGRKPLDRAWQQGQCVADLSTVIVPAARTLPATEEPQIIKRTHKKRARNRFLTYVGLGALCIAAVFSAWTIWVTPGMERSSRQHKYGESRAVILEARVGHHDEVNPTLFLAFPRGGKLYLVEIAGGDPQKTRAYPLGMYAGKEEDMTMTLIARDENGDGKIDLVIIVGGTEGRWILYNTGEHFEHNTPLAPKVEEQEQQQIGGQE